MSEQAKYFKALQRLLSEEPQSIVYQQMVRMLANRLITAYC